MTNGNPISWKSGRQDKVSLSTSKAKSVAASHARQQLIYLREMLTDFRYYSQIEDTLLSEVNLACIVMSENPVHWKFSRYIGMRFYSICCYYWKQYFKTLTLGSISSNLYGYVRCLLITESPKTPSHYRYQIWVLGYIPYTGLAVFSLRFLVFLCILRFRIFKVRVLNASE